MNSQSPILEKARLRKHLVHARRALSRAEVARWSADMAQQLAGLAPFQGATQLFGFVGSKDNEPDTLPILDAAVQQGKAVWLPVVTGPGRMAWAGYRGAAALRRSRWGILEPSLEDGSEPTPRVQPAAASCCLAPGLAFTPTGYRIGYGGGFYDRFLAEYPGTRIGLCFDALMQAELPVEAHDLPVDWVITETRAICTHPA